MGWAVEERLEPSPSPGGTTKLCTGSPALHWGGPGRGGGLQLCLVHLHPQPWAGLAPCGGEGARPSRLITVTQERGICRHGGDQGGDTS